MTADICDAEGELEDLDRLRQFANLRAETLADLKVICRTRHFRAGQPVLRDNDRADFIGFVKSGILRMQKTLVDGRQHIVGLLVEGDMFGQVASGPMNYAIEAASEARICSFPRARFERLMHRSPDLEQVVLSNFLDELDRARNWMIVLSRQKVTGRLAGFLLVMCARFVDVDRLAKKACDGLDIRIPISRVDLAHLLGSRPESISRAFHALADAGDIRLLKPDLIRIRDIEALAEKAGEDDPSAVLNLGDLVRVPRQMA